MEIWEQHDRIYHYTNHAGLQGILETHTLHATHYQYLNDTTEMFHMASKLTQVILPVVRSVFTDLARTPKIADQIAKDGGLDFIAARDAKTIVETLYKVTFADSEGIKFFEPFIASFCAHESDYERANGLLSQWRAYGQDSGYAVVYNTRTLANLLKLETERYAYASGNLGDVVYEGDGEGFHKEFGNLMDAIREAVPRLIGLGTPHLSDLYSSFLSGVPRYKHQGFREEREVRIVLSPMDAAAIEGIRKGDAAQFEKIKNKKQKHIGFKDRLVPYIVLFEGLQTRLPIEKVIVGPHRGKDLRLRRLSKYLELRNIDAQAVCSQTPLV